jgi:membrane glycosyltransferase
MHRVSWLSPRRTLGAWMVSTGLRLAPEERMHPRLRAGAESTEAPACAGASLFPA